MAFKFMTYLLGEAAPQLLVIYGGMPAREADIDAFFAELDKKFPQGVNWDIAKATYADASTPSAEAYLPNYLKAREYIFSDFTKKLMKEAFDVSSYVTNTFLPTLQAIADEAE